MPQKQKYDINLRYRNNIKYIAKMETKEVNFNVLKQTDLLCCLFSLVWLGVSICF
jgi:hypothetical protein